MIRLFLAVVFLDPLRSIYLELPWIGWGGKAKDQICAQVTGIRSTFWEHEGEYECSALVNRRFDGYIRISASTLQILSATLAFIELYVFIRRICYMKICSLLFNKYSKKIANG